MGIDFGTKKVGIALSDESGAMGFPYDIIPNDGRLGQVLRDLITREGVGAVVMGESRDYQGKENEVMAAARMLAAELERTSGIPVYFEPETLTTQAARRGPDGERLTERVSDRVAVDASAAALILTSYLDKQNNA